MIFSPLEETGIRRDLLLCEIRERMKTSRSALFSENLCARRHPIVYSCERLTFWAEGMAENGLLAGENDGGRRGGPVALPSRFHVLALRFDFCCRRPHTTTPTEFPHPLACINELQSL